MCDLMRLTRTSCALVGSREGVPLRLDVGSREGVPYECGYTIYIGQINDDEENYD